MSKRTKVAGNKRRRIPNFYLVCKSDPTMIHEVERFLMKANAVARLDDGTFYRLLVATTEAVNNAILHGNNSDPEKDVEIVCKISDETLKVQVRDEGKGFDPKKVPNPLDEKNLLKDHGRGVFIMNSMMDRVLFRKLKRGMVVEMVLDLKRRR